MTKRQLLKHFKSDNAIAAALDIKRQGVNAWLMDQPIPLKHELRLRYELRPDLFKSARK